MKNIKLILFIICLFCLTSCYTGQYVEYSTSVKYIPSHYYDNNISVVYINNIPYYQYWDVHNKCWYRKHVPVHRHKYITYKRNNKHFDEYHNRHQSRPSIKPEPSKPHNRNIIAPARNPNNRNSGNSTNNMRRNNRK